jgi:hypothetical protein
MHGSHILPFFNRTPALSNVLTPEPTPPPDSAASSPHAPASPAWMAAPAADATGAELALRAAATSLYFAGAAAHTLLADTLSLAQPAGAAPSGTHDAPPSYFPLPSYLLLLRHTLLSATLPPLKAAPLPPAPATLQLLSRATRRLSASDAALAAGAAALPVNEIQRLHTIANDVHHHREHSCLSILASWTHTTCLMDAHNLRDDLVCPPSHTLCTLPPSLPPSLSPSRPPASTPSLPRALPPSQSRA